MVNAWFFTVILQIPKLQKSQFYILRVAQSS